ncbi:hypothetical protein LWI29_023146 [Acer saccharum]|uniref:Uncharacterized protein n=1 Tax=Acer saccharum TaxID=4024 RepID=A0AA39W071_ACESA|nr:hypothetical protein LWI29_023146 [Acer saccharum]
MSLRATTLATLPMNKTSTLANHYLITHPVSFPNLTLEVDGTLKDHNTLPIAYNLSEILRKEVVDRTNHCSNISNLDVLLVLSNLEKIQSKRGEVVATINHRSRCRSSDTSVVLLKLCDLQKTQGKRIYRKNRKKLLRNLCELEDNVSPPNYIDGRRQRQENDQSMNHELKIFDFQTIVVATGNFSTTNKLGEGAILAGLFGAGVLNFAYADAAEGSADAKLPLPVETSKSYEDLEEIAKKERRRIEDSLKGKGLQYGLCPKVTVPVKGQKVIAPVFHDIKTFIC